jgi:hypothetical protein
MQPDKTQPEADGYYGEGAAASEDELNLDFLSEEDKPQE